MDQEIKNLIKEEIQIFKNELMGQLEFEFDKLQNYLSYRILEKCKEHQNQPFTSKVHTKTWSLFG
jgi:hypothetical protein